MQPGMSFIGDLTIVVAAAMIGGLVAHRLRQPLIVGYIVAGVLVGPFTGGLTVEHVQDIEQLAEIGVALLLFSLGLEVSFRELAPVRWVALAGASIQIVLTIALGLGLATVLGWPWRPALWFGATIALSSTMVALKTLQAQGRIGTLSSRVMLGILVVQDLAVVPLMVLLPALSDPTAGVMRVVIATGRAALLLALTVIVATRVVPRLLGLVARWNSRELFLLMTVAVALGVGFAAWSFGLSVALGAFIAGLVVNESDYAHEALSDIGPLRDVFGMMFFVSVGMLLDPTTLAGSIGALAVVILVVTLGKAGILAVIVRVFGYRRVVPLAVGLTLFQVGEFAFVLARVGVDAQAIDTNLFGLILNTAIVTMALTPVISGLTPVLYRGGGRGAPDAPEQMNVPRGGLSGHVVIAGAGRVGWTIADALRTTRVESVLIDVDGRRVEQAREAGWPVIYGDAAHEPVLAAASIESARLLVVATPARDDVRAILRVAHRLRPGLPTIARADSVDGARELYGIGVDTVASPEVEAAIEMVRAALVRFELPADEVARVTAEARQRQYGD
jgi:CPA2 family monovalent cation:H+ antiporter-2